MFICFGKSRDLSLEVRRVVFAGLSSIALSAVATAQSPAALSSSPILSQASQAFSAGKPVTSVVMAGTATWTAGSTKSSGPAKLTANVTGENIAEFDLSNGPRIEKQSALAEDRTCTWSGKDGIVHDAASSNCWTATIWFLPHLALQSTGLPSLLGMEQTSTPVERSSAPHIRYQVTIASEQTKPEIVALIRSWSITDLIFDPVSLHPTALKYNIHPDNSSSINLQVEVRYSNYKNVSGVLLPMHIERHVNGSLQLSIDIDSAVIN